MKYKEIFLVGVEGIRTHKLRSLLTMLGIIFGVAAVISMLSIGEGAREEALLQIAQMGINNIIIKSIEGKDTKDGSGSGLQLDDALALEEVSGLLSHVAPQRYLSLDAQYDRKRVRTKIVGANPELIEVMNYRPQQGAFFNYLDEMESRRVCVLGAKIKRDLFLFRDPVGQSVKIGNQWFDVVGVMEQKPASAIADFDFNRQIYIPLATAMQRFTMSAAESELDRIVARVDKSDHVREAANIMQAILKRRHRNVADYQISIPEELLRQRQKTQRIFNIVMGAIASISLLVGGIGIMNIMLATVMERTPEIGIRRAVGATQEDIMSQFLIEAASLSFLGGILGVLLGWATTYLITFYAGWKTIMSFYAVVLAFSVSAAVGIVFGFYPARQAARMDPIKSLRYE
jgi:putative ABC transport system permease protein